MAVKKFVLRNRAYTPLKPGQMDQLLERGTVVEVETDPDKEFGMVPGDNLIPFGEKEAAAAIASAPDVTDPGVGRSREPGSGASPSADKREAALRKAGG